MQVGLQQEEVRWLVRDREMTGEEIRSPFIRYRDPLAEADFTGPDEATTLTTLSPASLDRAGTRALGAPTTNSQAAPAGLTHTRAQGAPAVNPKLAPTGLSHTRALGATAATVKIAPAGLAHTRAQGAPTVNPKLNPAGLAHTRALGTTSVVAGAAPAGLQHTRALGAPAVSPQLKPAGQTHTRAIGDPTVTVTGGQPIPDTVAASRTRGVLRATRPTPANRRPAGVSQVYLSLPSTPTIQPAGLDRTGTRALGPVTVTIPSAPTPIVDIVAAGRTRGVIRAVRPATPVPKGVQLPSAAIVANPDPGTFLNPAALDRSSSRALGAPKVSPQAKPAGLTHTRAQGNPTVSPQAKPAGLQHTRAVGASSIQVGSRRALGNLTVTSTGFGRPSSLVHTRALGNPTARGITVLTLTSLQHTRAQGVPKLSGRALPAGIAHTRALGSPSVNVRTLTPAALTRTRALGTHTISFVLIARPTGLTRTTRTLGSPTARGRQTVTLTALTHTRTQGVPTLSGRALPPGLAHTRAQGAPAVNVRQLAPLALDRA